MMYVTIGGLDNLHVSTFSWTPQYRIALSWDLLAWISMMNSIPCSFTNFITTPKLSGAYSNEKPGVLTETLGVYSEPRGVHVGRLAGVALYSLRDGISWK